MVQEEPSTIAWFAIRLGQSTFGIFDAFLNDAGRQEHLSGKLATVLMERSSELFISPPTIEKADVLTAKLPQSRKNDYTEWQKIILNNIMILARGTISTTHLWNIINIYSIINNRYTTRFLMMISYCLSIILDKI